MTHKLRSRALTALLTFMLIIGLLPATAMAAGTVTVQINGQVLQDGVKVQCGEGTAVLDKQNSTLTLTNATINQEGNFPVVRVDNGDLKVILIGENTVTSTNMRPFYIASTNITIQGTKTDSLTIRTDNSDGLQVDNGNLTIDGCAIDITSANYGGMMCWGGTLTIQEGANVILDSFENSLIGEYGLCITDSTVNATARSNYQDEETTAVSSYGNISITNSAVTAAANGDAANAIYGGGTICINNSEVSATTTVQNNTYPALCAAGNIEIVNYSSATVKSAGTIGIWSSDGGVTIENSIGYIRANDEWDAIRGQVDGATIKDSWVETFGFEISPKYTSSDSVIFLNNIGTASGSLTLPGNVTVSADMQLSVPKDSSITVPVGVTFTNHGQIELLGDLTNDGGKIICDSHAGGTANCISKAVCDICGIEYGDFGPHNLTKTDEKEATCTEEGYTGDKVCKDCGTVLEKGKVIPKTAHNYKDGKCTVCGKADPNYKADAGSLQTGDSSLLNLWVILMAASALVIVWAGARFYRRNQGK